MVLHQCFNYTAGGGTLVPVLGPYLRAKAALNEPNSRALCEQFYRYYFPPADGWALSGEQRADVTKAQKSYTKNITLFRIDAFIEHAVLESSTSVKMTPVMAIETKGDDPNFSAAKMGATDDYVEKVGDAFYGEPSIQLVTVATGPHR